MGSPLKYKHTLSFPLYLPSCMAIMSIIGTPPGACGDDGGGHIGGLLCSGVIEDLIAECRQHPTQGLCGRLARRVIQKCQDQTTGLCPGSLKHISQNCYHGLQPVERANLTDIVLCVYKSLVSVVMVVVVGDVTLIYATCSSKYGQHVDFGVIFQPIKSDRILLVFFHVAKYGQRVHFRAIRQPIR